MELRPQIRYGAVLRLEDLLLRRVRVGMWDPPLARALVPALRPIFVAELDWTPEHWDDEVGRFEEALAAWSPEGVAP